MTKKNLPWATDGMREMAHLSTGCQLADENLRIRPDRFLTEANMQRLDKIRHDRDCDLPFLTVSGKTMNHPHPKRILQLGISQAEQRQKPYGHFYNPKLGALPSMPKRRC